MSINITGTLDSVSMKMDSKRICLVIEVDDVIMEMPQHIAVDVTKELQEMYQGIEFNKNFVDDLEKNLKLALKATFISLRFSTENNWILTKPLKQLYSPA